MKNRYLIAFLLYIIGGFHTMIFAFFEIPENFLMGSSSKGLEFFCKVVLYTFAIGVALLHRKLSLKMGLKALLARGLMCNILGLLVLSLSRLVGPSAGPLLSIFNAILFGMALTSVVNALLTYIILEFPKTIASSIIVLFAVLNGGVMSAPLMLDGFKYFHLTWGAPLFLMGLMVLSIWFVHHFFFDPKLPAQLYHPKKGSRVWKELHYRLGFFILAIVGYAVVETTFFLWGFYKLETLSSADVANDTISIFWFSMIIGQIILTVPLYFFSHKKVLYGLIVLIATALYFIPSQTSISSIISWLVVGAFGCSAVFPIFLSMLETEIKDFAKGPMRMPYIELTTSFLLAGYWTGNAIIDLWFFGSSVKNTTLHFHVAVICILIVGSMALFLSLTGPKEKKI